MLNVQSDAGSGTKVCTECGMEKDLLGFPVLKISGRSYNQCKKCKQIYSRNYREKCKSTPKHTALKKVCPRCGLEKSGSEFYKDPSNPKGLASKCKACAKELRKDYVDKHKDEVKTAQKEYRTKNKNKLLAYLRDYRETKEEQVKEGKRKYYVENRARINAAGKIYKNSPATNAEYLTELPVTDEPRAEGGLITVVCRNCGVRFPPTNSQVRNRIAAYTKSTGSEHNFYCSEVCKDACVLFHFFPHQQVDPRSGLAIPKTEQQEARACQTDHLKQLQLDEYGYNYCESCGEQTESVHLHHTQPIGQVGMAAVSSAGHLLMCQPCHSIMHEDCS